jgi:cathepsin A (carboxypeptidase C)
MKSWSERLGSAFVVAFALLAVVAAASGPQERLGYSGTSYQVYDDGLFTPLEDLNALSALEYTTLGHPLFPNHNIRIKKSQFCDETVK